MVTGLILVEHQSMEEDTLKRVGLSNAKQLVIGQAWGFGMVLHLAANTSDDFGKALLRFAQVPEVTKVLTLALRYRE